MVEYIKMYYFDRYLSNGCIVFVMFLLKVFWVWESIENSVFKLVLKGILKMF